VRTAIAVLGLFTLGAVAGIPVAADERVGSDKTVIERIMALAETDLSLRRADLGMIGSVLPAAPIAKPPAAVAGVDRVNRVDWVPAAPATPARPAVETVPAAASQN
jgi:hypothetical protein